QGRCVELLQRHAILRRHPGIAPEAVGEVDDALAAEAVLRAQRGKVGKLAAGVPVLADRHAPAVVELEFDVGHEGRAGPIDAGYAGHLHALRLEIADLPEAGRQPLAAAVLLEEARAYRKRGLVRVGLAV